MPPVRPAHTLHLTNAWHASSGGIRTFYRALMAQAALEGRRMTLVVPAARTHYERVGPLGRIYHLAAPASPVFDTRYRVLWPHRYLRPAVSAIWRILDRERPDLVEVCDKYSLVYLGGLIKGRARGAPRPTVTALSSERMDDNADVWLAGMPGRRAFARQYIRRVYLPQFDAHIANSEYTAAELLMHALPRGSTGGRLDGLADRVHVAPMGVEAGLFGPHRRREPYRRALAARVGAAPDEALVLYAGRLSPEKHVDRLVPVAEQLRARGVRFRLIIAGDGPSRRAIERDAAACAGGCVRCIGHLDGREELADLLANVDLFLHPNPKEPFGIGPLEAMASGTAVVAPASGGVLEYASPRNAWLADPDPQSLASAVDAALGARQLREDRVRDGLRTAAALAWPRAASRILALYDHIHTARLRAASGRAGEQTDEAAGVIAAS